MARSTRCDNGLPPARHTGLRVPLRTWSCSCLGALVAVLALAVALAPPADATSRAGRPDEDRTLKLDLISRSKTTPEIVVLGSSRGRRAEPAYLKSLTGRTGFNAAVGAGTAADAWVMTRYLADCLPLRKRRYIWFVDTGVASNGINPGLEADPRSHRYLGLPDGAGAAARRAACSPRSKPDPRYNPDGSYRPWFKSRLREHSPDLAADVAKLVASVRASKAYTGGTAPNAEPNPKRYVWFERALAFMNSQGSRPVIVFNPIHPTVLAELRKTGFPARETARRYLTRLHERFDFVVVDGQDIRRWGGSPNDFWDAVHINFANMRRLLAYVVAHSDGALR